jgi:site-specific recombinase XerD
MNNRKKQIKTRPFALFDTLVQIETPPSCVEAFLQAQQVNIATVDDEYQYAVKFLSSYSGSADTFNTYRREVERLLQWSWLVAKKSIIALESIDIHHYMDFVQNPPETWIATKNVARFIDNNLERIHNPQWCPFVARIPKALHKQGHIPKAKHYKMGHQSLASVLAVLSTFYSFLQQHEFARVNPVQMLRQKSRYLQKRQGQQVTRKLSQTQWAFVIETMATLASKQASFERHLFIISAFYLLGLRISELAETPGRIPQMGDFYPDQHGCWWFTTVGKGNKQRDVAVPDTMLQALKRYRIHLELPSLPLRDETTPLVAKQRGYGGLGTRQIRNLVQACFNHAVSALKHAGQEDEALDLEAATVHWLRHTAISADVQHRPREHVRDDAGHENTVITDRYIDIDRQARHESAKHKPLVPVEPEDGKN